jgi:hypothetical protein
MTTLQIIGTFIAFASLIIAFLGILISIRAEFRRNHQNNLLSKIDQERRHSDNEQSVALLGQKISTLEHNIAARFDEINSHLHDIINQIFNKSEV